MAGAQVKIWKSEEQSYGEASDWRWHVEAANGEVVASGEGYTRREDAVRGFGDAARAMAEARARFVGI